MSARETIPDSVQRTVQSGEFSPIELDEYLPGSVPGVTLPGSTITSQELEADIAELEASANEAESAVIGDMVGTYQEVSDTVNEIESNIVGGIANQIDGIEALVGKLTEKLVAAIVYGIDEIYSKFAELGFNTPTREAVQYGLSSGDFIGSVVEPTIPEPSQSAYQSNDSRTVDDQPFDPTIQPWWEPNAIDTVPAWPMSVCYCPSLQPLITAFSWDSYKCDDPEGYYELCTTLDYAYFVQNPKVGNWVEWLMIWSMPGQTHCDYRKCILPSRDKYGQIVFLWIHKISRETYGAAFKPNDNWEKYECSYRIKEHVLSPEPPTYPPEQPPLPPVEPPPPQPPTQPPGEPVQCPVDAFNCGIMYKWMPWNLHRTQEGYCGLLETWQSAAQSNKKDLTSLIGMLSSDKKTGQAASAIIEGIVGGTIPIAPSIWNRLVNYLQSVVKDSVDSLNCDNAALAPVQFVKAFLELVDKWTGTIPDATLHSQRQLANSLCQYLIPSPAEADSAYLADAIDKETWKCFHKAAGNYISEAEKILYGKRTRPSPLQVSQLYRQKLFGPETFKRLMRQTGITEDEDRETIHELTRSWPGISDVTRFLVRDVADQGIVDRFGMDDDFKDKWQGKLIDYADAIGVNADLGKYYWRAHWHIPSFTQLSEMLHRLRPGKVPDNVAVTKEDVFTALKQDDWMPFWANRLIETSYRPVTKFDAIRAYSIHAIDEKELKERFLDIGMNNDSADFYVEYHKKRRKIADTKAAGYPTIRMLTNQYARCQLSWDQYRDTLSKLVLSEAQEAEALNAAKLARDVEERKRTIASVMQAYRRGLISEEEASQMLAERGIDPSCVPHLIQSWEQQKRRQSKYLQASQLCKMRKYGIITAEEQASALVRGNWSVQDAARITETCTYQLTEEQAREALAAANKAKREMEKQAREDAKRRKSEQCGPPPCPANTPGGQQEPPIVPT